MPMMVPLAATPMLTLSLPRMLATMMQTLMHSMVPNMDTVSRDPTMRLGASLRDRATLSSPLRGLAPSGGYPSRLRSLRSLRAPLARRLASLVRALLRSAPALRSAPRRAVVPAPVRTLPPAPPAACCARLPAAPAAPSATQSPWRLQSAGFAGVDSLIAHTADLVVLTARGGLGSHTRRIVDAWRARLPVRRLTRPDC